MGIACGKGCGTCVTPTPPDIEIPIDDANVIRVEDFAFILLKQVGRGGFGELLCLDFKRQTRKHIITLNFL